jgi:hypothetical protein
MALELGKNPGGRPRGHGLSYYICRELEKEMPDGSNKKLALAAKLVSMALDPKTPQNTFLAIVDTIMDRLEGKPLQTNVNAEVGPSPLDGIPTEVLEALRAKADALRKSDG